MGKTRKIESVESRLNRTSFDVQPYEQAVHTAPARIFKEKYLTKKGKKLMTIATTDKERKIIRSKYEKNRYINNPDCDAFRNPNGKTRRIKHT